MVQPNQAQMGQAMGQSGLQQQSPALVAQLQQRQLPQNPNMNVNMNPNMNPNMMQNQQQNQQQQQNFNQGPFMN